MLVTSVAVSDEPHHLLLYLVQESKLSAGRATPLQARHFKTLSVQEPRYPPRRGQLSLSLSGMLLNVDPEGQSKVVSDPQHLPPAAVTSPQCSQGTWVGLYLEMTSSLVLCSCDAAHRVADQGHSAVLLPQREIVRIRSGAGKEVQLVIFIQIPQQEADTTSLRDTCFDWLYLKTRGLQQSLSGACHSGCVPYQIKSTLNVQRHNGSDLVIFQGSTEVGRQQQCRSAADLPCLNPC
ncbi:hypothetical protein E2C01_041018 [Portunus trituberculatus]|uniref:Uncharacterized protein n=1 Tax=Portunus trituberculatus TaxID=210409 RepID=A0A5B7FP98_PORTR|nr:hypothetical protein [Portunus trituberculatus]